MRIQTPKNLCFLKKKNNEGETMFQSPWEQIYLSKCVGTVEISGAKDRADIQQLGDFDYY